jgi:predicted protein tyrosine phosphatase
MKIVIRNYLAGSFLLEQEPKVWDAIVILDSGLKPSDFVAQHAQKFIYLRFDDVTQSKVGKKTASSNDIRAALDFSKGAESLLVCCRAGQSRSAAVAFIIACQRFGSEKADQILNAKRHVPNSWIVELGANLLDDPHVLQAFAQWQRANANIKLSNYMDEIEREYDDLERQGARNRIVAS